MMSRTNSGAIRNTKSRGQSGLRTGLMMGLCLVTLAGCRLFGPEYRPAPDMTVKRTEAKIERGKYLAETVTACVVCHTKGDKTRFSKPPITVLGSGGDCYGEKEGFPGTLCGPNITNHADALGSWTDGEIVRAIREGVDRDDNTLFPMMPYTSYRYMSDDDVEAIVAYIRSATVAAGATPETDINWPVSMFVNMAPEPVAGPVKAIDKSDTVAYGEYLTIIAGCRDCHSPVDGKNALIEGKYYSGGHVYKLEGLLNNVSPNITPHETGIKHYTKEAFIGRFKAYQDAASFASVTPAQQSIMPWWMYANMAEDDLGAIYDFLMTVPPIENKVNVFPWKK